MTLANESLPEEGKRHAHEVPSPSATRNWLTEP
jgi:hypothetical protein